MTFTGLPHLQAAIVTRLRMSADHMSLVTGVFDEVPQLPKYPHEVIDGPFETPDRTFGQNGHECTVTLSVFTQSPSTTASGTGKAGWAVGLTIAESALALLTDLENNPLTVDGHDVLDVDVVSIDCVRETDGKTRRVDVNLIVSLEDTLEVAT